MGDIGIQDAIVAGIILESTLYGLFLLLSFISLYAMLQHGRRFAPTTQYGWTMPGLSRPTWYALKRPMFLGGFAIMVTVSGHWISSIVQLFQAFHHPGGVEAFVADPSHATQLAKNIFLTSSAVIGNMVIIYPLWVVWDRGILITVIPIFLNLGTGGTVICYLFRTATAGTIIFIGKKGSIGPWIAAESLLSTCANIYCSAFISWKIWNHTKDSKTTPAGKRTSHRSLSRVLLYVIESAALYAIWQIASLTAFFMHSAVHLLIVDSYPAIAGISFMSINASIYFTNSPWDESRMSSNIVGPLSSSYPRRGEQDDSLELHSVRPVAVQISVHEETITESVKDGRGDPWGS
ncbi:hypothetical protein PQX77_014613 [Marasmius sp. AFHP31]|nr:hypothetical protein PQX77_019049 [Marasmius sp. AFHP31]KAK1222499.1 hypothetical protein PQX77_014613 [Marasmius sp. AFHP31]